MTFSGVVGSRETLKPSFRQKLISTLKPIDNGPREIRALDGLRATAALFVVTFHLCLVTGVGQTPLGMALARYWGFFGTGVELFFVLSGFLLFLPYARAMLHNTSFPSTLGFLERRALRILPAYWVCLTILIIVLAPTNSTQIGLGNVLAHIALIHNTFPAYNRAINGPFWTLAVEAQFYITLPLLAIAMSRVVGATRSHVRLIACLLAVIAFAVLLRKVDGVLMGYTTSYHLVGKPLQDFSLVFVLLTYGSEGKFLDIFAMGMICSVLYVVIVEDKRLSRLRTVMLGYFLLVVAIAVTLLVAAPNSNLSEITFIPGWGRGWVDVLYPLVEGLGYSTLLLAVVFGSLAVRFVFESPPMRFIGLISYSLYLWHLPILSGRFLPFSQLPTAVNLVAAFVVAYLSYTLVERPFLRLRLATRRRKAALKRVPLAPAAADQGAESITGARQPLSDYRVSDPDVGALIED